MAFRFKKSWHAANDDKQVLEDWCAGVITTDTAIQRLASNNSCDPLTEVEFIELVRGIGYKRKEWK